MKAGNSSKVLAQMTLNATTMSVMLNNLTTGAVYNVRVVAYTRVGAGPYSMPVCVFFIVLYDSVLKAAACKTILYTLEIMLVTSWITVKWWARKILSHILINRMLTLIFKQAIEIILKIVFEFVNKISFEWWNHLQFSRKWFFSIIRKSRPTLHVVTHWF